MDASFFLPTWILWCFWNGKKCYKQLIIAKRFRPKKLCWILTSKHVLRLYMIHLQAFATFELRSRKSVTRDAIKLITPSPSWKNTPLRGGVKCFSYSSDKRNICLEEAIFLSIFTVERRLVLIASLFLSKRKMIKLYPQFFAYICF